MIEEIIIEIVSYLKENSEWDFDLLQLNLVDETIRNEMYMKSRVFWIMLIQIHYPKECGAACHRQYVYCSQSTTE